MCCMFVVCVCQAWAEDEVCLMSEVDVDVWVMTGVVAAGPTVRGAFRGTVRDACWFRGGWLLVNERCTVRGSNLFFKGFSNSSKNKLWRRWKLGWLNLNSISLNGSWRIPASHCLDRNQAGLVLHLLWHQPHHTLPSRLFCPFKYTLVLDVCDPV